MSDEAFPTDEDVEAAANVLLDWERFPSWHDAARAALEAVKNLRPQTR